MSQSAWLRALEGLSSAFGAIEELAGAAPKGAEHCLLLEMRGELSDMIQRLGRLALLCGETFDEEGAGADLASP